MSAPEQEWYADWGFDDPVARAVWIEFGRRAAALRPLGWRPDDVHAEYRAPTLIVGIDIVDRERGGGVRTLRADFDGRALLVGEDPTYQFVTDFVPGIPGVHQLAVADGSPSAVASAMVAWFAEELRRPVYREEWDNPPHYSVRWVLGDEGRVLCGANQTRQRNPQLGKPARRSLVAGCEPPSAAG